MSFRTFGKYTICMIGGGLLGVVFGLWYGATLAFLWGLLVNYVFEMAGE